MITFFIKLNKSIFIFCQWVFTNISWSRDYSHLNFQWTFLHLYYSVLWIFSNNKNISNGSWKCLCGYRFFSHFTLTIFPNFWGNVGGWLPAFPLRIWLATDFGERTRMISKMKIYWILQSYLGFTSHLSKEKMAFHKNIWLPSNYHEDHQGLRRLNYWHIKAWNWMTFYFKESHIFGTLLF